MIKGGNFISYLDFHRKRLCPNGYETCEQEDIVNSSREYIEDVFSDSPLYQIVNIENKEYRVRIWSDKIQKNNHFYEQKQLLFKPNVYIENGSYVILKDWVTKKCETWLVLYFESDILTPKAHIRKCTKVIEYKGIKYPIVIDTTISSSMEVEKNSEIVLPKGHLLIYIKSNKDTMNIKENTRFLIDNDAYSVQTIENSINTENGVGIVILTVKKVPKTELEQKEVGTEITENIIIDDNTIIKKDDLWGEW